MGLPGKRRSNTSKRTRNAHIHVKPKALMVCDACGAAKAPHKACQACGTYKGKKVVNTEKRAVRRAKKVVS